MRLIGSEEYGQYSFLISQCNLIVALGFGWLNQAQLRYFTIDSFNKDYRTNQINALLISTFFCFFVFSSLRFFQTTEIHIWIVLIITITLMGCFNYLKTIYQAKLFPNRIIGLTSIQSLFSLIISVALIFLMGPTKFSLILGLALSFFIVIINFLKVNHITQLYGYFIGKQKKNNIDQIKKWIVFGSPLSLWFAAGLALSFLDRFFINLYLPNDDLGMYASIQELLIRSFSLTLFPLTLALHPRIMNLWNQSQSNKALKLIIQGISLMLGVGIIGFLIIWQYNDSIFFWIQKAIPQLNDQSKDLIVPLFCSGFFWQLSFLTHKMLEIKEQTLLMLVSIIPSLIINIIGNSYFLPKLGWSATAYSAFFSALIYCLITGGYTIYSIYKFRVS